MLQWFRKFVSKKSYRDNGIGGTVPPPDKPRARIVGIDEPIGDGGPAFPQTAFRQVDKVSVGTSCGGLTMRDYFAAFALQGYISSGLMPVISSVERIPTLTKLAYDFSDGMLAVRLSGVENKETGLIGDMGAEILDRYKQIFAGRLHPDYDNDETRVAIANDCRDAIDSINQREIEKIFGEPV
jgi:hypothetical protein